MVKGRDRTRKPNAASSVASAEVTPSTLAERLVTESNDPNKVRGALDDAAAMARNLWLAFLTFGTYLVIAVGSVTHRDLFLEQPIKLPLLNVELPLVGFFVVAPILFIIFHAYLLLNLRLLVDNVKRYNRMVESAGLSETESDSFRLLLTNFPFVQLLAGTSDARRGLVGGLLTVIVWVTVVLAPVMLLVMMELQFLPYHSEPITWLLRIALFAELALLWVFWPSIMLLPRSRSRMLMATTRIASVLLTTLVVVFILFFATFPGEYFDKNLTANRSGAYTPLFGEGDGSRHGLVHNTLFLPDQDFVDGDKLDKVNRSLSLRFRDLRGAILVRADLRKADLTGAKLEHADLFQARLNEADFAKADLRRANLSEARLEEAVLQDAQVQQANMVRANLNGAKMAGARFDLAQLAKARLAGIHAMGTGETSFRGSDLSQADFRGASLQGAQFLGAVLTETDFRGARLNAADFSVAAFSGTKLDGAYVHEIRLWRTYAPSVTACASSGEPIFRYSKPPEIQDQINASLLERISASLDDEGKAELRRRLAELWSKHPSWSGTQEKASEQQWVFTLSDSCGDSSSAELLQKKLIEIACSVTANADVSRGLLSNGILDDLDEATMKDVSRILRDQDSCPGAVGLTEADFLELRRLAVPY